MNSKNVKKLRQYYRRDLRGKLGLEVELARHLIKIKPRLMPRWLYKLGARLYFDQKLFNKYFNGL